jgi:hypothetical protein
LGVAFEADDQLCIWCYGHSLVECLGKRRRLVVSVRSEEPLIVGKVQPLQDAGEQLERGAAVGEISCLLCIRPEDAARARTNGLRIATTTRCPAV